MREEIFSELVMLCFLIRGDVRSGIIDGINVRVRISHQDRGVRGDNQLATVIHQFMDTHQKGQLPLWESAASGSSNINNVLRLA